MSPSRHSGYVPQDIEPKWQKVWADRGVMKASDGATKPKFYNLVMFPYPSGPLHMVHMRNYVIGDVLSRFKRMQGFEVLNPMGWDAFGLPAENDAIKRGGGVHPEAWTRGNIAIAKRQLGIMGVLYDWDREVTTCDPSYYRWTQELFLLFFERGLAHRMMSPVNWCPVDKTVLANEQVINGRCWRHPDVEVEKRDLEQWFLRITEYADRLLDDLADLEHWPEKVRVMQAIWVGDYVLITYGTGAIMAVPAHDQRDFDFARQFGLPIRQVIASEGLPQGELRSAYTGPGVMVNSGEFDGLDSQTGFARVVDFF